MAGVAIDRENSKVSSLSGRNLATGVSPSIQNPQNAESNAKHKTDPVLTPLVTIRPRPSCPAAEDDRRDEARAAASPAPPAATPPQQAARRHHTQVTSADVLEAIHKASGQDVIGDHFSRLHDPASGSAEKVRLFDALNTICDVLRLRWSRQETPGRNDDPAAAWLTFRSTSFFNDRLKEVPNRLLAGWRTARREHGSLPLADLLAIAGLHDAQLDSRTMAASVQTCYDLPEWSLAAVNNLRPHWRFLAGLPRPLREAALSEKGLSFRQLPLAQQQQFVTLTLGPNPAESRWEDFANATLQVQYQPMTPSAALAGNEKEKKPTATITYHWGGPGPARRHKILKPNSTTVGGAPSAAEAARDAFNNSR
jgi:hypothetical protein